MGISDLLAFLGGVSLFLFGMSLMGSTLQKHAAGRLRPLLSRWTAKPISGFFAGLILTAVIQSSTAVTVLTVRFVDSGLLTLRQALSVIAGANVGTTVTAWLVSLGSFGEASSVLLSPAGFTPLLAFIGVLLLLGGKSARKKDAGMLLLGFVNLMNGMEAMTRAAAPLQSRPEFSRMLLLFEDPLAGVLTGAVSTALLQSSAASIGILQALAAGGQITLGAAVPIVMGQNIGTCLTALLSAVGAGRNARRAALLHLCFNILGTAVCLPLFLTAGLFSEGLLQRSASAASIAAAHSLFNLSCSALLLPAANVFEALAYRLVPERAAERLV